MRQGHRNRIRTLVQNIWRRHMIDNTWRSLNKLPISVKLSIDEVMLMISMYKPSSIPKKLE